MTLIYLTACGVDVIMTNPFMDAYVLVLCLRQLELRRLEFALLGLHEVFAGLT
jgi:hypothetical protein